jgi:osmotically-inducible protein OsmY
MTPTSDRPDVRVYSTATGEESSPAPPRVADPDIELGLAVSQLLKGDPYLNSVSSNVETRIIDGVVELRGSVPTASDRDRISNRISRVPGVARVDNDLGIDLRL